MQLRAQDTVGGAQRAGVARNASAPLAQTSPRLEPTDFAGQPKRRSRAEPLNPLQLVDAVEHPMRKRALAYATGGVLRSASMYATWRSLALPASSGLLPCIGAAALSVSVIYTAGELLVPLIGREANLALRRGALDAACLGFLLPWLMRPLRLASQLVPCRTALSTAGVSLGIAAGAALLSRANPLIAEDLLHNSMRLNGFLYWLVYGSALALLLPSPGSALLALPVLCSPHALLPLGLLIVAHRLCTAEVGRVLNITSANVSNESWRTTEEIVPAGAHPLLLGLSELLYGAL